MKSLRDIGGPAKLLCQPLSSLPELKHLSDMESRVIRPLFKREHIRIGPPQSWLGHKWDLRIAAVKDMIFKVAIETKDLDKSEAEKLIHAVEFEIHRALGLKSKQRGSFKIWDADDGNVVLQLVQVGDDARVMLFLTSRIIRSFSLRQNRVFAKKSKPNDSDKTNKNSSETTTESEDGPTQAELEIVAEHAKVMELERCGKLIIGIDRPMARRFYMYVPSAEVRKHTGESTWPEKAHIWHAFVAGPLILIASIVVAFFAFTGIP